jgi:hypothetical protein
MLVGRSARSARVSHKVSTEDRKRGFSVWCRELASGYLAELFDFGFFAADFFALLLLLGGSDEFLEARIFADRVPVDIVFEI